MTIGKIFALLLISGTAWGQQSPQQVAREFNSLVKVEDEETFYNDLITKQPADPSKSAQFSEYRAQLAVDWLTKGNIEKYKFYKSTHPKFTSLQLFDLSNLLEYWVDDNKHTDVVAEVSREILDELDRKMHDDVFGRSTVLLEVNAMANARLGNIDAAMKSIEKSTALKSPFRDMPYFRNSKANYLNRYGMILLLAGRNQEAFDTLSNAVRTAVSTPKTVGSLKAAYKKLKGEEGADKYIASLQEEAYQKIYKDVEKEWFAKPKAAPGLVMTDMNGKQVKMADYKGKIVVADFWSTVCKPCVAAFPAFQRAVDLYKDDPFRLFVINVGESPEVVKPYMEKKGYKLDVLFDNNEAFFKAIGALGTPQKFIIDPKGNIHLTGIGYAGADDKEFYKLKAMVELTKARSK